MAISKEIISQTLATPYGERAYKIVETLTDAGYDTWWVGGGVRDMLLGKLPKDIDIATSAKPQEIEKVFSRMTHEGHQFGSVRVLLGTDEFEVTTFREDDEASDGRHPESIVFGNRPEDAKRRDFTINAIYFNPISRELFDPFHGAEDLKEGLIRFIGDPAIRIKHDALRMLRAVRFRATIAGQYHPETYAALQELAQMVEILSGARQLQELEKMLLCPHPDRALQDLWDLQILHHFLPELAACKGVAQPAMYHHEGDVWEHMMHVVQNFRPEQSIDLRIAALFHDSGKVKTFALKERIRFDHHATVSSEIAQAALKRLQMGSKRIEKISWIIQHHMMMGSFAPMPDERKAHWYFHPWFAELLQHFYLDEAGTVPPDFSLYESILKDYHHFLDTHPAPPKPLLSGEDVMENLSIQPGEEVGRLLKILYEAQIRGEITSKSEAKALLQKMKAEQS